MKRYFHDDQAGVNIQLIRVFQVSTARLVEYSSSLFVACVGWFAHLQKRMMESVT